MVSVLLAGILLKTIVAPVEDGQLALLDSQAADFVFVNLRRHSSETRLAID
ncbi:hypothetical protein M0D69_21845 [Caballeronia sp. SEWSISQ10-4 2]|uniref:hypothetical protein n=1 Tax=Caballeronia sp. SEWSISQ10-4 2 TaxID=2937438 RepID=UPI00264BCFED|nr:hypothetical protein [Caballeronia sp. SEWSISQ10-4 2]MDN7180591.1 hypothetical protein [Caballeronia sp. SEWSISQ10-4 2]